MATLVGAREPLFSFGQSVVIGEQHRELERAVDNAAVIGSAIGRCGAGAVAALFEQHAEVVSRGAMAALVGARQPLFGFGQSVVLGEQHPELERAVGIASLVGSAIGRRGAGDVAALFEQHAEVVSGGAMAGLVCACQGLFGFGQPVLLTELDAELECRVRIAPLIDRVIRGYGISQMASSIVLVFANGMLAPPRLEDCRRSNNESGCGPFTRGPEITPAKHRESLAPTKDSVPSVVYRASG